MLILFILSAIIALYLSLSLIPMLSILFKIIGMKADTISDREFKADSLLSNIAFALSLFCALATAIFASHYFYNNI